MTHIGRRAGIPAIPAIKDPDVYATFQALREVLVRVEAQVANLTGNKWADWSPRIGSSGGQPTAIRSNGRYLEVGKTIFYHLDLLLVTVGGATGNGRISLPMGTSRGYYSGTCWEVNQPLGGQIAYTERGTEYITLTTNTGTTPFINNRRYIITGFYEML